MVPKVSLRLVVLFLVLSYVLSCAAVPTTRSLKSNKENPSTVQDLLAQDAFDMVDGEELFDVGEGYMEVRLLMENTDYPGTGANNHHDPKTPGRA